MTKQLPPHMHPQAHPAQNHVHHGNVGASPLQAAEEVKLSDLFAVLNRNRMLIISITLLFAALAAFYAYTTKPLYSATALMQIDVRQKNIVDIESVTSSITSDESAIKTEVDILRSRTLAAMVVEEFNLEKDPEFNPSGEDLSAFSKFMNLLSSDYFFFFMKKEKEVGVENDNSEKARVINAFLSRLDISRKERSYTIGIAFTSESNRKAQILANAVANAYLRNQLDLKYKATQDANQWLSERLKELQKKLQDSERELQQFKVANNLTQDNAKSVIEQQLTHITNELVNARTSRTQSEAKLENIRQDINSVPEVVSSSLIQSLRTQEVQVVRKRAELSSRYGPKHPKMINVNNELQDLKSKIQSEIENIITSIENEVKVSRSKEEALEKSLESLKSGQENQVSESAVVQLAELSRQVEANKALYESFLTRFNETSEKGLEQADAKIFAFAEVPQQPSYPPKFLIISGAAFFAFFLSIAIVFLIEELDSTFRSTLEIEKELGVRALGMVPHIKVDPNQRYMADVSTSSVFFESLRTVLTATYFSRPNNIPKSILVSSSVPGEGKTFFSLSFASMLAQSGMKVLLIDCDLKRAALSQTLAKGVEAKYRILSDFITGKSTESEIVYQNPKTGLHFIISHPNTAHSQNILSSERMRYLIQIMSLRYDYVVLDCPPVMAVSDALVMTPFVDTVIYAVQWGKTPKKLVTTAVNSLKHTNAHIAGVVLTQVNLKKHSKYSYGDAAYYYSEYKDYYTTKDS